MTAQPAGPAPVPDTGSYEVIHPGGQAAVVVPVAGRRGAAGAEDAGGSRPDLLPARR
jgi:hypothetical protein